MIESAKIFQGKRILNHHFLATRGKKYWHYFSPAMCANTFNREPITRLHLTQPTPCLSFITLINLLSGLPIICPVTSASFHWDTHRLFVVHIQTTSVWPLWLYLSQTSNTRCPRDVPIPCAIHPGHSRREAHILFSAAAFSSAPQSVTLVLNQTTTLLFSSPFPPFLPSQLMIAAITHPTCSLVWQCKWNNPDLFILHLVIIENTHL